ncbi:MAG: O-antigen ligase family protein [Gemmatimonadaceae bacterium]
MPADSAPTSRDRLALYVLQVGAVAVVLAAARYKAFDLDRYFVSKELVLHTCALAAAALCASVWRRITVTAVDVLLAAFLAASLVSAVFATNHWAAERAVAISISGALLFWSASALRRVGLVRPLLVALAVGVVVGAGTSLAQAYGIRTEYFSLNRAPGGTLGNRNFIAHLAAIGAPLVALVALTARRGIGSLLGALGMVVVAAALVLSRSRAAWLAILILAAPVCLLAYMTRDRWMEPRTVRRIMLLGAATVAGGVAAVAVPNSLEWKSDSPYLDSAAGLVNYKEGSGHGRLIQYENSLKLTKAHPLFGVGPGNWPVAYPSVAGRGDPSMSQSDEGMTSNPWPSSDLVADISERGVIGFGLLILVTLGLLGRVRRELSATGERDPERTLTAIALVGTLVATIVVGAVDAVLLIAVPTFFVWTLAGALSPPASGGELPPIARRFAPIVIMVLGGIAVARSAAQLAAIAVFSTSTKTAAYAQAALLDPGSYRIRTRLAQAYIGRGDCGKAKPQSHAAHALFPSAAEPKRQLSQCGTK